MKAMLALSTSWSICPPVLTFVIHAQPLRRLSDHLLQERHWRRGTTGWKLSLDAVARGGQQQLFVPLRASAVLPGLRAYVAELLSASTRYMVATLGELHEVLASRPSFLLRQSKNGGIVRGAGSADMSALLAAATSLRQTCRAEFGSRSLRSGAYEGGTRRSIAVHSVGGAGLHSDCVEGLQQLFPKVVLDVLEYKRLLAAPRGKE